MSLSSAEFDIPCGSGDGCGWSIGSITKNLDGLLLYNLGSNRDCYLACDSGSCSSQEPKKSADLNNVERMHFEKATLMVTTVRVCKKREDEG